VEAFLKIMVLSVVQGLTEFLPVSSSGHLVLAKHFLGLESPGVSLELFLHGGTLLAVIVFYRAKLLALLLGFFRGERAALLYALWVFVSMIPAGAMYVWKGDAVETAYGSPLPSRCCSWSPARRCFRSTLWNIARRAGARSGGSMRC